MCATSAHACRPARRPPKSETYGRRPSWTLRTCPTGTRVKATGSLRFRVSLQRFGRFTFKVRRHRDLDGDEQVAMATRAFRHATAAHPQDPAVRCALGYPDTDLALQRRHRKRCAQRQLVE